MKLLPVLAVALALAGCGGGSEDQAPAIEGPPTLEQAEDGNFTLYVSNQSFDRGKVDITVWINGFVAVDGQFEVGSQHNWSEYRFNLADGPHTIRAATAAGETVFEESFEVEGKRWAVVDYWCCDSSQGEPKFSFLVSEEPIGFA
jgi:hypothetical protein